MSVTKRNKKPAASPVAARLVIKGDSWRIREWPRDVYPNDADKARYLIRSNLTSLNAARAVCRAGRELYVNGDRYRAWLESSERQLAVRGFDFNLRKQQHKE